MMIELITIIGVTFISGVLIGIGLPGVLCALFELQPPSAPEPQWTDEDFIPHDQTTGTVEDVVQTLRLRFRDRQSWVDPRDEPEIVEQLKLLICVRSLQGWTDEATLAELLSIGAVADYATHLVASTLTSGKNHREFATPVFQPRAAMTPNLGPVPSLRHSGASRAVTRLRRAQELVNRAGCAEPAEHPTFLHSSPYATAETTSRPIY